MSKFNPAPRPDDLKPLAEIPSEPPIVIPTGNGDAEIFAWTESIRDHYEGEGVSVSARDLLKIARTAGLDDVETKGLRKQIKKFYAAELSDEPSEEKAAAPKKKESKTKPEKSETAKPKKKGKKEMSAKAEKTNPKNRNNGKSSSKKKGSNAKKSAPAKERVESTLIAEKTVKGIPVNVYQTGEGQFRVTFFGIAMRKVFQWMGATQEWTRAQAETVANRLLSGTKKIGAFNRAGDFSKGAEVYVKAVLDEGHVGAGARAGLKKKNCFGRIPEVAKDQAKAFRKLLRPAA